MEIPTSRTQAKELASKIKRLQRAKAMYELYTNGTTQKDIASMYNLSVTRVQQIINKYKRTI